MVSLSEQSDYEFKRGKDDDVGAQLANYGKQMRDLLATTRADVRTYKFSVEKTGEGFDIDVVLKISFYNRRTATTTNIKKSSTGT